MIGRLAAVCVLVIATATAAHAQEIDMSPPAPAGTQPAAAPSAPAASGASDEAFHKGTLGFSFPITLLSNLATQVTGGSNHIQTIDFVYFLNDQAALDLIGGFNFHRQQADNGTGMTVDQNLFGFALGLGYRAYSSKNALRSFIEPQAVINWADTSDSSTFALDLGLQFGLERNITTWFSVSGAIGAGLDFANSFKDIQFATTVTLAANLYWR
jgi:hypothetical protein